MFQKRSFFAERYMNLERIRYNQVEQKLPSQDLPQYPIIDIRDVNPMRADLDGTRRAWSPDTTVKRPKSAPVKIMGSIDEVVSIALKSCRSDKKTGMVYIEGFIKLPGNNS